jgi:hypothetical protein
MSEVCVCHCDELERTSVAGLHLSDGESGEDKSDSSSSLTSLSRASSEPACTRPADLPEPQKFVKRIAGGNFAQEIQRSKSADCAVQYRAVYESHRQHVHAVVISEIARCNSTDCHETCEEGWRSLEDIFFLKNSTVKRNQ